MLVEPPRRWKARPTADNRPAPVAVALSDAAIALLDQLAPRLDAASPTYPTSGHVIAIPASHPAAGGVWRGWWTAGISAATISTAARDPAPVACLAGIAGEAAVYALAAAARGLVFRDDLSALSLPANRRPPPWRIHRLKAARLADAAGDVTVLAPPVGDLFATLDAVMGVAARRVIVTTPRRLEARLRRLMAPAVAEVATMRLATRDGALSAGKVPTGHQRRTILGLCGFTALAGVMEPQLLWQAFFILSVACHLALALLRLSACLDGPADPAARAPPPLGPDRLPSASVLVPLHDEAAMVTGLLAVLDRLDYPADRLEILLLVEEDDRATAAAVARQIVGRPRFALILVPPGHPRTKPRALAFGLAFAAGDMVSVFDAEDRPHPLQLRAAAAALAAGPPSLACVQARLEIDRAKGRLQRQFAVEYAALFEGLLPWYGRGAMPLPLGGTSNHFKREALEIAHGWDPWNVTEDADLGLRLMRYGFAVDVFDSVTYEEAPDRPLVWFRQRVRWMKGWMVTFLVHAARPRVLAREIGWRNTGVVLAQALGSVGAALCHPIGVLLLALHAAGLLMLPIGEGFAGALLFAAAVTALLGGYGASMLLAARVLRRRGRRDLAREIIWMPLYWLAIAVAAWAALAELLVDPHRWAKTPHRPHDGRLTDAAASTPAGDRSSLAQTAAPRL